MQDDISISSIYESLEYICQTSFFLESILSYSIKKAFQSMYRIESMYQIEEKGMKTRNHGFSRLLIQVNKRYKKYAQKNKYICKHCAFHLPMESLDRIFD